MELSRDDVMQLVTASQANVAASEANTVATANMVEKVESLDVTVRKDGADRRRSRIIAYVAGSIGVAVLLAVGVAVGQVKSQTSTILEGRDASRANVATTATNTAEIKALAEKISQTQETLLSYSDPNSDIGKQQATKTAEFITGLVGQLKAITDEGVSKTAAIGLCRTTNVDQAAYLTCIQGFGISLPAAPSVAP